MSILLNAALPVFAIIITGYIAGRSGLISNAGAKTLNDYVFYIALPAMLFLSTATAPRERLTEWGFLGINLGGIAASFLGAFLVARFVFKKQSNESTILGMAASYGNTGYLGVPLVIALYGNEAVLPAALATLLHNIPVIAAVLLTLESSGESKPENNRLIAALKACKPLTKNPLMLSVAAGLLISAFDVPLPAAAGEFARLLSNAAGPTALFAIGLSLVGQARFLRGPGIRKAEITLLICLKLLVQPLIALLLAIYVFEADKVWVYVSVLISAMPVGANVYIFASKYSLYKEHTIIAILVSTILCILTLPVLFYLIN